MAASLRSGGERPQGCRARWLVGWSANTEYWFTVRARTSAGWGADGPAGGVHGLRGVAPAFSSGDHPVGMNGSSTGVVVSYEPPASDGGSAVIDYQCLVFTSRDGGLLGGSGASTGLSCTLAGGMVGEHGVLVYGAGSGTSAGWGADGPRVAFTYAGVAPASAPVITTVGMNGSSTGVVVSYEPPASDGGSAMLITSVWCSPRRRWLLRVGRVPRRGCRARWLVGWSRTRSTGLRCGLARVRGGGRWPRGWRSRMRGWPGLTPVITTVGMSGSSMGWWVLRASRF